MHPAPSIAPSRAILKFASEFGFDLATVCEGERRLATPYRCGRMGRVHGPSVPTQRLKVHHRCPLLALCAVVLIAMAGCGGRLPSSRGYVLARPSSDGAWEALAGDDPLYTTFGSEVMADPLIAHLMSLFDGICGAYAATSLSSETPQTLRNYPILVISHGPGGLLRDVRVEGADRQARVEYAIALGVEEGPDLARQAREALPGLLAQFLLAMAGHAPPDGLVDATGDQACVPSDLALWLGYMELQEARRALGGWSLDEESDDQRLSTAMDSGYWACCPMDEAGADAGSCLCGRGMAGLMAELIAEMPAAYPQKYMLWFANFKAAEVREAKLLLAFVRMGRGDDDALDRFVASYADTFPAEAERVRELGHTWRARMAGMAP